MGITIHYKGCLDSPGLCDSFLEELIDIAKSMEWEYTDFSNHKNRKSILKGIFIKPHPESDILQFMVDKNGFLRNAVLLEHLNNQEEITFLNHTKTQFASAGIHIAIIKLLKYLKKRYISNLEVIDEGDYWETEDVGILQEKINFLNQKLDKFGAILESIEFDKNETTLSLADKIEKILNQRMGNN